MLQETAGRAILSRIKAFLADFLRLWRERGMLTAFRLVRKRIYERNENLLFELRTTGVGPELPPGWRVEVVTSSRDAAVAWLLRAGGESELPNFQRQAVAYVLCIGDEAVARHWFFPQSALARWMGPGTAYFGSAFVKPEWRGRGINTLMLTYMAARLPVASRVILEVESSNLPSQKSLLKTGCRLLGLVRTTVCLARLVRVRVDESPLVHSRKP
jgi:ribosomal protein S18 acetylase RimI-like enzyme